MTENIITKEQKYGAEIYSPLPFVIKKGKNVWLYDESGKKYLDMMSAYSAASFGHCNKDIIKTLKKQSGKLNIISRAFHNKLLASFLENLCKFTELDKAIPMNTGAEAVETAIKAARLWGYKNKKIPKNKAEIIVCKNNFHGRTSTIIGFSSEAEYKENFGPFSSGFKEIPYADAKALKKAINGNTCAFLVETIQGEAGIITPPDGWLKEVQTICKENNVLLILDEIQCGMGRAGKDFAFQYEIDKPDGLILGKALGGGVFPVSAFIAKNEIMDLFKPGSHGSTFGGNPLACAIANKAISLIKDQKLSKNSKKMGELLINELRNIKSPIIKEIRGKGLFIGVEIQKIPARDVVMELANLGILTKETHETTIRLAPPLIINKKQINFAIKKIEKAVKKCEKMI